MRRAFTLIELLVVIGIMSLMVTVGIVGIRAGKSRSQLAGATRDVLALIRQARSIALITQQPSVITYSNESVEDETSIKVEVQSENLFDGAETKGRVVHTLNGEAVGEPQEDSHGKVPDRDETAAEKTDGGGGETLNDVLSPRLSFTITKGLRIKVEKGEDESVSASVDGKVYKSAISVFSTVEYVSSKYGEKKSSAESDKGESAETVASDDIMTEPVKVVWQTNGRTEPHTIWIYPDGAAPDHGLTIVVDKFGDCKVSQWAEDER